MSSYLKTGYATNGIPAATITTTTDLGNYFNLNLPIGSVMMYAGTSLPLNYLWCDGTGYSFDSSSAYYPLYNVIKFYYNVSTTPLGEFAVPDFRTRMPIGSDTTSVIAVTYNSVTSVSGGDSTMTSDQMPSHTHTATLPDHAHYAPPNQAFTYWQGDGYYKFLGDPKSYSLANLDNYTGNPTTLPISNTSSVGGAEQFIPKYCAFNYIIKFS